MKNGFGQLLRYGLVGIASNAFCYGIYLVLAALGCHPMLAMSLVYAAGVTQTFFLNRRWTFRWHGANRAVFLRYCAAYGLGYTLNLIVLYVLVQRLGYPHQIIQAGTMIALALMLFLLQKFWVFRVSSINSALQRTSP